MPSAFSTLDQNLPRFTGGESLEKRVAMLQDYQYQLLEQLRYTLSNLGKENFNAVELEKLTEPILEDVRDRAFEMQLTAERLVSRINEVEKRVALLRQTTDDLSGSIAELADAVNTLEGRIAALEE